MNIDLRKSSHIWFFVVCLPITSYFIGWEFVRLFPSLPFWVEGISPMTAYGLLLGFFDKVAWHWSIFRVLKIVTVPDVRGRWLGEQVSSYVGEDGKHMTSRAIMEISQTFSGVHVHVYYQRWSSKISVAQFVEIDQTPTLFIMFDTERKVAYEEANDSLLRGVCKLVPMPDGRLEGTYFNAAGRHGEIVYKRTGYKLAHTFSVATAETKSN